MENLTNNKKNRLEIIEVKPEKVIFKSNYAGAFCLNASQEKKTHYYSLPNNQLNQQKLKKLFPDYSFPPPLATNNGSAPEWQLRDYQKEDVEFLSQLKSAAIFSEMRTGKTPIALLTYQNWGEKNLLIITPSILQYHWQKSVEEWLNKPAYIITYLDKPARQNFYQKLLQEKDWIIIVSKDTFKVDSSYFQKLKKRKASSNSYCVIIDEAHFLRNYQSKQSKSIWVLRDAAYKMVLTGTPIVNHYMDIFGILKFLQPEIYSSYWKFAAEYFTIQKWEFRKGRKSFPIQQIKDFKNPELQQALQQKINEFSVNRKQVEVLPWLPPVIYQREYLLMEEEQQNIYLKWIKKWPEYQSLEILAKLKTLTLYPPAFGFKGRGSKINFLLNYLTEIKNRQIIVFSTRTETFLIPLSQILKKAHIEVGMITGQTSNQERQQAIQRFQNKELNILLCNIQAAGMGLNLSRADTAIFADRSYSPADNEQAEARFLPTNDQENKQVRLVIDLICKGSIDEKIKKLLKRKEDIIKVLNNNPEYYFS
jgi:SNF2 family DNA or RNA helicase